MAVNTLFLDAVWGLLQERSLYGEVRAFKKGGVTNQFFVRDSKTAMQEAINLSLTERMDVYFGVMPRTKARGRAEDCVPTTHVLWADFDAKNFRSKTGLASAYTEIANMRLIPHIIVDSGHGYHAYWLLDQKYPFVLAQPAMKGMERMHRTDHCSDQARILRLPGTLNFKDSVPTPVRLVRFDTARPYPLDAFHEYASLAMGGSRPATQYKGEGQWDQSKPDAPKFGEGQRNGGLMRLAAAMVHKGLSPQDVQNNLLLENIVRCDPPLPVGEVEAIARSVERYRE